LGTKQTWNLCVSLFLCHHICPFAMGCIDGEKYNTGLTNEIFTSIIYVQEEIMFLNVRGLVKFELYLSLSAPLKCSLSSD
jgi:hypothetical protein